MNCWIKITNIGTDKTMKRSYFREIQLTNSIIFISSLIALIYCPILVWLNAFWMAIQLSALVLLILLFLLIPAKLKIHIALPLVALGTIYHMTVVSIVIQNSQLELYIILISLIQFAVIKSQKITIPIFILGILAYFGSTLAQDYSETIITMTAPQKIVMNILNSLGLFLGGLYLIIQVKIAYNKFQSDLLKERRRVVSKNQKIELQVKIIAETNKAITDSINYSKRIQNAILPSKNKFNSLLPESFVYYNPKDIVAGDFYWVEKTDENIHFAVADCTGHGVPGAMMSVVCSNALNRALKEFKLLQPNEILDKTRDIVMQDLETSEGNLKDGMDIALCKLSGSELTYAGANIKLYLVRDNELLEYKPDKQPIGLYIGERTPYTNHTLFLQEGDTVYLITDGYVDQFGGKKIKKFKTTALKKLLLSLNKLPMDEQKQLMSTTFDNWKGSLDQIDDVCVMGVLFNKQQK